MLFRPHKEIYIGKFRLPFTPGLIPKEKNRIAAAIGKIIGNELLNSETLGKALCSDEMQNAFYRKYENIAEQLKENDKLLKDVLEEKGFSDSIEGVKGNITQKAEEVLKNLNPMLRGMAAGAIEAAKMPISVKIDNLILEKCPEYVEEYLGSGYEEWMDKPVSEVTKQLEEKFPRLKYQIWIVYETFMDKKSENFIQELNIPKVVEEKINEFDMAELEKMIMEIAKKELNALVWLGGLLGMLMGFVNLLF